MDKTRRENRVRVVSLFLWREEEMREVEGKFKWEKKGEG